MARKYQGPLRPGERSAYVKGNRTNRRKAPYRKEVATTTKETAKKNASLIKSITSKLNGHVQRGYHYIKLRNDPTNPTAFLWAPNKPVLIPLNDFYTQTTAPNGGTGSVYYPIYSGTSPNITMNAGVLDRWVDYLPGQSLGQSQEFNQWKDQQFSQPSKVGYQPLYTDIRVNINRRICSPSQGDMWVRIDMFSPRKIYLASASGSDPKEYNMPTALGALSNMASGDTAIKNSFNPALWSVKTRWIKLPAVNQPTGQIQKNFHIRCGFPKKFLPVNLDVTTGGVGEPFWQAMDPREIKWCMLSLSNYSANQTTDPTPDITMTRKVVYRDSRGAQM
ncbi:MAG: hypothetical protein [Circular genetic element sp.]|nr:MAG: hypothetical protein [Circular genetic element sp.]